MGTGVHSTHCKFALLTSTLGCQTTLLHGGCTVEVQGCPCLEPRQPVPPRPRQVLPHPPPPSLPPLSWLHSHPCGSPLARAQATLLALPGPLLSLEDLSPQGAWGPVSTHLSDYRLWERQSTVWGPARSSPWTHSLFFGFIYWSSLRCLFKTSTVAFKKTVKSLCSTLRIKSSFSTLKWNWRED